MERGEWWELSKLSIKKKDRLLEKKQNKTKIISMDDEKSAFERLKQKLDL